MTNATSHGVRRYSDLLTTGYIKTGADGRKIFYPWGIFGNGYAFPSNDAYERLNDLLKIFTVVALAIIMPVAVPGNYIAAVILAALSLIFYVVWISFEVRKLQRTDEKMTYGEGYTNLARLMPGCAPLGPRSCVASVRRMRLHHAHRRTQPVDCRARRDTLLWSVRGGIRLHADAAPAHGECAVLTPAIEERGEHHERRLQDRERRAQAVLPVGTTQHQLRHPDGGALPAAATSGHELHDRLAVVDCRHGDLAAVLCRPRRRHRHGDDLFCLDTLSRARLTAVGGTEFEAERMVARAFHPVTPWLLGDPR